MSWTAPKTWVKATLTSPEMNEQLRDNVAYLKTHIALEEALAIVITAGGVTVTQAYHKVDTEAEAATDDLDTISGGTEGKVLILRSVTASRVVTLKHGTGNLNIGGDIVLDSVVKHVQLICNEAGNWVLLHTARRMTFTANSFHFSTPTTEWTPQLEGAYLNESLSGKTVWLPLDFLKVGDAIVSYKLVGDAGQTTGLTLDCKLVRVNVAHPLTTTDVAGGVITQVTGDNHFSAEAVLTAPEVVAVGKQYVLEIDGTTGAGDTITVMGAEVVVRRLV